jgi:glycine amidinotransferase
MTYSVYQHWDPLKVCIVGRSYPPEFYSWIDKSHVRNLFERIAIETEEDYQNIINKLKEFNVEVLRPDLPEKSFINGKFLPPPMTPRDTMVMVGDTFYEGYSLDLKAFYSDVKGLNWPDCSTFEEFNQLPAHIQDECRDLHNMIDIFNVYSSYDNIFQHIRQQGNIIKHRVESKIINGAMMSRIGKDLYFGTASYTQDQADLKKILQTEFTQTRNHIVNTGGHSDGTYCPVCPGLIISLQDVPTYADTFPGWEVVYLPGQSWHAVKPFLELKQKNDGRWWIPGFENDNDVVDTVEQWLGHWTGYVEETVFDVNMLIIDPKNVLVFNYNRQVFDALDRHGITPHVVPFRHRYFWDGGIHCITSDLHREGIMQDYFPERSQ